jgi:hypothetical protein
MSSSRSQNSKRLRGKKHVLARHRCIVVPDCMFTSSNPWEWYNYETGGEFEKFKGYKGSIDDFYYCYVEENGEVICKKEDFDNHRKVEHRRNVVVGDSVPNIVEGRRAGKWKNRNTKQKWSTDDTDSIRGIAIAVPPDYAGLTEILAMPIEKHGRRQKKKLRKKISLWLGSQMCNFSSNGNIQTRLKK